MDVKQVNEYAEKLCNDIKLHYLKDYCGNDKNWFSACQLSMRNFVLSRQGWLKSEKIDDTFVFVGKHHLTVNIIYSGSPGMLMLNTAIGIAKAELIDNFNISKENTLEDTVTNIEKSIRSQDWIIPFVRNKHSTQDNNKIMNKYTTILRWLSIIPAVFTIVYLSDWIVKFTLWFLRLPIVIFEKIFGFGSGPIGKLFDNITNFLFGLNSIGTLTIIFSSLLTMSAIVYLLAVIIPKDNKSTARILAIIFLTFFAISLVATFLSNRMTGEVMLYTIVLTIGAILGWNSIKKETEKEREKHEYLVQKYIKRIFIFTTLFTVFLLFLS